MKFLFVGLGSIGQRHLRNLRSLLGDTCKISAYRVRKQDVVLSERMEVEPEATLVSKYGVREFDALADALSNQPDAVFITNPTRFHVPVALEAARAGCHLFIEKPLSDSEAGVEELLRLVARKGLIATVGYQLRFHPGLRAVKHYLASGRLGQTMLARLEVGEYLPNWHPYEDYRNSYAARRDLGGGALVTQSHEFDYALWLFGMPRQVFALGGHLSRLEVDVEDAASVLLACPANGTVVPVHVQLDYVQWPPVRSCVVVGDEGRVLWDYGANRVTMWHRARGEPEICEYQGFQRNQLFVDELRHFLACLRGEAEPGTSLQEAAQGLRVALAARRSLETGEVVGL